MRFCLIIVALLLASCAREPLYQSQSYVFGTLVDVTIYGESDDKARAVTAHIFSDFQNLHQQLHAWQDTSELSKVNKAIAEGKTISVSPLLSDMLKTAQTLSAQSEGLFNPAIGHLIHLWGFQSDSFTPHEINPADIEALLKKQPSMQDLTIANGKVTSRNPAVKLDLGGFAKGYALDLARDYLRTQGVKHALINIGGNVIALGQHGDRPWRVGIQHPRQPNPMASVDLPDGWAIGTSGDYQRYFELQGKRYCHILDPRTGHPVQRMQAVTVLIPPSKHAGTLSDVGSKPIFISEAKTQAHYAQLMGISHYLTVDQAGKVYASPSMKKVIRWTSNYEITQ